MFKFALLWGVRLIYGIALCKRDGYSFGYMALGECYQDHVLVSSRIASAVSEVSTLDCVSLTIDQYLQSVSCT